MVIIDRNNAHHGERDGKYAIKPKHTGNTAALGADVEDMGDSPVQPPTIEDIGAMHDALRSEFSRGDGVTFTSSVPPVAQYSQTPIGEVRRTRTISVGILEVRTDNCTGYKLSPERNKYIPEALRQRDGWYHGEDTSVIGSAFPMEYAAAQWLDVESARETYIAYLMGTRSREMEEMTGLDIGGAYQRDQKRQFDEILSSPGAAERYIPVELVTCKPSKIPGAEQEIVGQDQRIPVDRRFIISESQSQSLLSDYVGPSSKRNTGRLLADLTGPQALREVPESHGSMIRLIDASSFRLGHVPYVSSFASVADGTVTMGGGAVVSPRADVRGTVDVGRHVLIGRGALIDGGEEPIVIPESVWIRDNARVRKQEHIVRLSPPGTTGTVAVHPWERKDHTIGTMLTFVHDRGLRTSFEVGDTENGGELARKLGVYLPESDDVWFTDETVRRLVSLQSHWAQDPSLRTLPKDFVSVVDIPWNVDDGALLIGPS